MLTFPGIPTECSPGYEAFFTSFWPSLYSGLISGLLTGVVVGLIVIVFQRGIEKRLSRKTFERDISLTHQKLLAAVSRPESFTISSAEMSAPLRATAAMEVIQDIPLSLWRSEVKKQRKFLDVVNEVQLSYSAFRVQAIKLDHLLQQFSRKFASSVAPTAVSAVDTSVTSYILGRLQGFERKEILSWIQFNQIKWLDDAYEAAKVDEQICTAHSQYSHHREQLMSKVESLVNELQA